MYTFLDWVVASTSFSHHLSEAEVTPVALRNYLRYILQHPDKLADDLVTLLDRVFSLPADQVVETMLALWPDIQNLLPKVSDPGPIRTLLVEKSKTLPWPAVKLVHLGWLPGMTGPYQFFAPQQLQDFLQVALAVEPIAWDVILQVVESNANKMAEIDKDVINYLDDIAKDDQRVLANRLSKLLQRWRDEEELDDVA